MNQDFSSTISLIASVATLILFIFYFVGRAIIMRADCKLFTDEIKQIPPDSDEMEYNIVDVFGGAVDQSWPFVLTAQETIRNVQFYEYEYDAEYNQTGKTLLGTYPLLNAHQSLLFFTREAELIPWHCVHYTAKDFRRVEFDLIMNGKNGVMSDNVHIRHTLKSIIYYLVR